MMNSRDIASLVPDPDDLLRLPVEEQASLILKLLMPYSSPQHAVAHSNFFSRDNDYAAPPKYGPRQKEIDSALMVAWSWLEPRGFLVRAPSSAGSWYFVSDAGRKLALQLDTAAYQKAQLLPREQLHPAIAEKAYPAFLQGKYDAAIFEAFLEIEIAVRQTGNLSHDLVGDSLMRAAFTPAENNRPAGPLADVRLPVGEQRAMSHLFAGAFGVYRNSTGHRRVSTGPIDAVEVIMFASQLMRIVDRIKPSNTVFK
jgi:uncharacterized protein (TIGR02391 family)